MSARNGAKVVAGVEAEPILERAPVALLTGHRVRLDRVSVQEAQERELQMWVGETGAADRASPQLAAAKAPLANAVPASQVPGPVPLSCELQEADAAGAPIILPHACVLSSRGVCCIARSSASASSLMQLYAFDATIASQVACAKRCSACIDMGLHSVSAPSCPAILCECQAR